MPRRRTIRRNTWLSATGGVLMAVAVAQAAVADVVHLKDGKKIVGDIKKTDAGWQVTGADGKITQVPASLVSRIELGSGGTTGAGTPSAAASSFQSLKRASENLDDPAAAVERYRRFIDTTKDAAVKTEAEAEMAVWLDRQTKKMTRVAGQWVTPEQKNEMVRQSMQVVQKALLSMQQGRVRDAEPLVRQVLDVDPANPPALYLRGVIYARQDQLPNSKKSFDALNAVIAEHAPTLNNLSVINFRLKNIPIALTQLDQAIIASPVNRDLLNNAAELLNAIGDDQRKTQPAIKLSRHVAEQEGRLQEIMQAGGLYRWGATWVDRPTLDTLHGRETEIKQKLDKLAADFNAAEGQVAAIDRTIADNEQIMRDLQRRAYYTDANGNVVRRDPPRSYYDLQDKNQQLERERATVNAQLDTFRETAKRIQQEIPTPKFTGVMRIIDIEGTPLPAGYESLPPTTNPAAAPLPPPPSTTQP